MELVEEGAGFGAPIIKYADKTFFSGHAALFLEHQDINQTVIRKVFVLNAVSEKQLNGISLDDTLYHWVHRVFAASYLTQKKLKPLFDQLMVLRKTLGIKTRFIKVAPRGKISVTYHLKADTIKIHADLSHIKRAECREILFLNEQGAGFFVNFEDAQRCFDAADVGGWSTVPSSHGCFSTADFSVSFSALQRRNAQLLCGREKVRDRFAWAGLTYALPPPTSIFNYEISLRRPSNVHKPQTAST